jgi:hypothetical protein
MKDIHVIVVERDTRYPEQGSSPIVFEQYIDKDAGSIESVTAKKERLGDTYGRVRIAKLVFIDD